MKKSSRKALSLLLSATVLCTLLSACSADNTAVTDSTRSTLISDSISIGDSQTDTQTSPEEQFTNGIIKEKDLDTGYDPSSSTHITLSDSGSKVNGAGASVSENTVSITAEGTYILTGTLSDGRITVSAPETSDIHIVLDDASVSCADYSPFTVESADNVYITLAKDTRNAFSDGSEYTLLSSEDNTDAAVFSKADLTINGSGSLTVKGNYSHGICTKDDLIITGGTFDITSVSGGIIGKDSVNISNGTFSINAGTNGIKSANSDDADKGDINIYGGTFSLTCGKDGIEAQKNLLVQDGTFNIKTGTGSQDSAASNDSSVSSKALKAEGSIVISGGTVNIDSSDDSVHSNSDVTVSGGTLNLSSGDDGIHADANLIIKGGTVNISKSYEGLEGMTVAISGGNICVKASDDGINSAGGSDTANPLRPGRDPFASSGSADCSIVISGGYTVVDAYGDGVDSNGTLSVTGGVLLVSGPVNDGNGALDAESGAVVSGGYVIAAGSPGMAQGFGSDSSQCSLCYTLGYSASDGTNVALLDGNGNVLVSFTPAKAYSNVVISAPGIKLNETYTIQTGGTVSGTDSNGYANSGTCSGGKGTQVTQSSVSESNVSNGGMGGAVPPGGMGGARPQGGVGRP